MFCITIMLHFHHSDSGWSLLCIESHPHSTWLGATSLSSLLSIPMPVSVARRLRALRLSRKPIQLAEGVGLPALLQLLAAYSVDQSYRQPSSGLMRSRMSL